MAWSKLEDTFRDHRKFKRLARRLKVRAPEARGLMAGLWSWCTKMEPDGDLSNYDLSEIADAADWHGRPERLFDALVVECLLDVGEDSDGVPWIRVHNFLERAEAYKKAKQQQNRRVKAKEKGRRVTEAPREPHGSVTVTLRGEEKRGEEKRGEEKRGTERRGEDLAHVSLNAAMHGDIVERVAQVFDAWRRRHHDEFVLPNVEGREGRSIQKRLAEGVTVEQILEAIEGIHVDPWADRSKNLTLMNVVKTQEAVSRFRRIREEQSKPKLDAKTAATAAVVAHFQNQEKT